MGLRVIFIGKKDVYERYLRLLNLANSRPEDAQQDVHFGYVVSCSSFVVCSLNISRRGLSRVAYPGQGNARAQQRDERGVEHPRLSV